jgi:type II secretory pathway component PulF
MKVSHEQSGCSERFYVELNDLISWTHKFSVMVGAGISIVRCLLVLAEESSEPLKTISRKLARDVERGETISRTMSKPEYGFPAYLIAFVRSGEVGGVLDETLAHASKALQSQKCLLAAEDKYRRAQLSHLCRTWSSLLASGVTILTICDTLSQVHPDFSYMLEAKQGIKDGIQIGKLLEGHLPETLIQMITIGEETGSLDSMLEKAAELYKE